MVPSSPDASLPNQLQTAVSALAVLYSGHQVQSEAFLPSVVNRQEEAALKTFEQAGRHCLAQLSPETLLKLQSLSIVVSQAEAAKTNCENSSSDIEDSGNEGAALGEDTLRLMFEQFEDGDGLISLQGFEQVLKHIGAGDRYTAEELRGLAAQADANSDGSVDFEEFVAFVEKSGKDDTHQTDGNHEASDRFQGDGANHISSSNHEQTDVETTLRRLVVKAEARASAAEASYKEARIEYANQSRLAEERLQNYERESEVDSQETLQFWQRVMQSSASPVLEKQVKCSTLELLGQLGKFAFIFKALKQDSPPEKSCQIKLFSKRWARMAIKEWSFGEVFSDFPGLLAVGGQVLLHSDTDQSIAKLLLSGMDDGKFRPLKRSSLPDQYICLFQDFMNRGTVQNWIDDERLSPEGVLMVTQRVAAALAYMHQRGVSHNDVRPQNVYLHQNNDSDPCTDMLVKLGEMGSASRSGNRTGDFRYFGMTVFCMVTGEKFDAQRCRDDSSDSLLAQLAEVTDVFVGGSRDGDLPCAAAAAEGTGIGKLRVHAVFPELQTLLMQIWSETVSMAAVRDTSWLQGWGFFDEMLSSS